MVIYVKNPSLKKRIFKSIRRNENLAIKSYEKGKMRQGNKYDSQADRLYKKNYSKMFGRR